MSRSGKTLADGNSSKEHGFISSEPKPSLGVLKRIQMLEQGTRRKLDCTIRREGAPTTNGNGNGTGGGGEDGSHQGQTHAKGKGGSSSSGHQALGVTFMEPPEEWVLHTSSAPDSNEVHECCCRPEDVLDEIGGGENGRLSSTLESVCHGPGSSSESDITPHSVIFNVLSASPPPHPSFPTSVSVLTTPSTHYHTTSTSGSSKSNESRGGYQPPPPRAVKSPHVPNLMEVSAFMFFSISSLMSRFAFLPSFLVYTYLHIHINKQG
jgi:hypothetical protein